MSTSGTGSPVPPLGYVNLPGSGNVLIRRRTLEAIKVGDVDLAFRRWKRPTVRTGGRLRTAVGVLAIEAVEVVDEDAVTQREARRAGYRSREELFADVNRRSSAQALYRIELRHAGADPRLALRESSVFADGELDELRERLRRLDSRRDGPWTRVTLELIADQPGVPAARLAAALGREKEPLKRDVRKLKELGLTESLSPGYRLSPRGEAAIERLVRR